MAKTTVMMVSNPFVSAPTPVAAVDSCTGLPAERVNTFKYLGLHFHASGDMSRPITPLKAKVAGSWAVVQQKHSQLQSGNMVNLKLFLLQSILGLSLHYACELWGMHSPFGASTRAQTALQSIYEGYLRHICRIKYT